MYGSVQIRNVYLDGCSAKQIAMAMMNVFSGGKPTANNLDFRKVMIAPVGAISLAEALRMCIEVYQTMKNVLKSLGQSTYIGDEGGFMPNLVSNEEALAVILGAIQKAGYKPGEQIALVLNVAASDFFEGGEYNFPGEGFIKTPAEMVEYYARLVDEYPILSIEEGMAKDDREGWMLFTELLGGKIQLVERDTE